jgi:hypothetical protein
MKKTPTVYFTITGRRADLKKLSRKEKQFLSDVIRRYERKPSWTSFASWWNAEFQNAGLDRKSPTYRVCQDLEARLGIAEGKVAPPNYRDYLADLIEDKYGSRYRFCREKGVDQAYVSRILAGRSGLTLTSLGEFLRLLDVDLVVRRRGDWREELPHNAVHRLRGVISRGR